MWPLNGWTLLEELGLTVCILNDLNTGRYGKVLFVSVHCLILPPKALAHKDPADFKHDDEELIRKLVKKVFGAGKVWGSEAD